MKSGQKAPLKQAGKRNDKKTNSKPQKKQGNVRRAAEGKTIRSHAASLKGKRSEKVRLISSKIAYRGPLFDVYTDYICEPKGEPARRDVIRHSGSVVILAVDDTENPADPQIVIERQYRHSARQYMWEIPAGRKEPGEDILPGAKRELQEEVGYSARRWTKLARFYVSPGFLGEWMQVYLAEGLTSGQDSPDEDEYIEHRKIPFSQALHWVESGKIIDAKSIVAILLYARRLAAAGR